MVLTLCKSSHSIATRLLTTVASDAGGGVGMWNYIRGDYILPRLIFQLSAVAGNVSLSLVPSSPLFPPFLYLSHTLLFFLSLSSLSPAYLHVSPSPSHPEKHSIHKLSGHMWVWIRVGPFSVISHNKVNKQGCCVGCLWTQRERLMEREEDKGRVRDRGRREQNKTQPAIPKEEGHVLYFSAVALISCCVWQQVFQFVCMPVFPVIDHDAYKLIDVIILYSICQKHTSKQENYSIVCSSK